MASHAAGIGRESALRRELPLTPETDLYDSHYGRAEAEVYRAVREDAFGEDLGQTSWITAAECDEFAGWLRLRAGERVLEVACGSGGVSVRFAERSGVSVVGVDRHESAVASARRRAERSAAAERLRFEVADADRDLPFADGSFDAIFCNDSINHFRDRDRVFREWRRVLAPGGRCLYTDPIVVTGPLTNAEIAARSSIGHFVFTPEGADEPRLRAAGLAPRLVADGTDAVARSSGRWREARERRRAELVRLEGEAEFGRVQEFLEVVHRLASERRLSRFAVLAERVA